MSTLILINVTNGCKKSAPPSKPRCKIPPVPVQVSETGGWVSCTGHADRYFNVPKVYDDVAKALTTEGGVIENGTLIIKKELIVPKEDPETSECHLVCLPGFIPSPSSSTSCNDGVWTQDPITMTCATSPCGVPPNPEHGKYHCYGNPSTCYLACDPGYVTMSTNPALTCKDDSWSTDPHTLQCEVAVALLTGGIGPDNGHPYPEKCQTAEVFSPSDETCSSATLPLLRIGVTDHTSHLVDGEILMCGGNECGRTSEKLFSGKPIYNDTKSHRSCFKMLSDNTWTLHSVFSGWRWNHMGFLQQNVLQLIAGNDETLAPVLELQEETWVPARSPSLPPTAYATSHGRPCLVVTSPTTYIVIGGSHDLLSGKYLSSVLEFNSLTGEWRALPNIPVGRVNHACALVTTAGGPGVMVAGGKNFKVQRNALDTVFLLDLGTEKWYPAGNLNDGRENFGLAVLGERVMVIGRMSRFTYGSKGKNLTGKESVEEYVVPCPSLKECTPSQEGVWTLTDRVVNRRSSFSVVSVAASRFNCSG